VRSGVAVLVMHLSAGAPTTESDDTVQSTRFEKHPARSGFGETRLLPEPGRANVRPAADGMGGTGARLMHGPWMGIALAPVRAQLGPEQSWKADQSKAVVRERADVGLDPRGAVQWARASADAANSQG
jgi:hypothetical protein